MKKSPLFRPQSYDDIATYIRESDQNRLDLYYMKLFEKNMKIKVDKDIK